MYKNCNILNAKKKHCFTFLMLHPMCCNSEYFDEFINYFSGFNIFENIKFIFPEAPLMNIDYPNNNLYNIPSWYNYYTCYNNISKVDIINYDDFKNQTNRITEIINNEAFLLNNYKKIFIIGISQGGTLLFNVLNKLPRNIGGLFCIKSIYMDKYIKLKNNKNTPIFIFSGNNDYIYNIKFQKKTFKLLKKKKYNIKHIIINNLDHDKITNSEHEFIINNFISLL
jgi:predicted esterase